MASISIRADIAKQYGNTITEVVYSDLPTNLDVLPYSGDLAKVTNQNAVSNSIRHIVMTMAGDRPYSRVGSTVNFRLFQLASIVESQLLQNAITNAISSFEPRISTTNVTVTTSPNNDSIIINVQYTIININQVFTTQIILERNR